MLSGLKHAHSGLRWVVLALLIWAIVNAYQGWKKGKAYTKKDLKVHKFAFIGLDVQLLIGFALFALNWGGKVNFANMADKTIRFFTVEHSFLMIIAIAIVHIGFAKSKKIRENSTRFKTVFVSYFIALIIILAMIPWPFAPWNPHGCLF